MNEEDKRKIIYDVNLRVGGDVNELTNAYNLENELLSKKNYLQSCLQLAHDDVPTKSSLIIKKAEDNSKQINSLKSASEQFKNKVETFMNKSEPYRNELEKRFAALSKLEQALSYLKSFEKIDNLSSQMKQTTDDEQLVVLYGELKEMCNLYQKGHRAAYVKEYTHYWHNILKDKIASHYEDVLKSMKWPFSSGVENAPPSKEVLVKFNNITRYLFLIQEPEEFASTSNEFSEEQNPCLPVRILLRPLKKRFTFHFTGSRKTARIDRPEWFLTQTLTWIRDNQSFVQNHVQPIADKLELKSVRAVDEFNAGLIALAAERLHTVLAMYQAQGAKGEIVDVDAAFAHAIDEALGFHRELIRITGKDVNSVLSVLTRAETFVRWLAVQKKYALATMDETLGNEQWSEAVAAGVGAAVGSLVWVPRGADWFINLLKTIEDRYAMLPQPGHRLQFLELQLELVEEWRVRLTQLLTAALETLAFDTFMTPGPATHPLTAVINAAHHTRTVLLQWEHALHYLQLHYYRRQFHHFTQQQHHDDKSLPSNAGYDSADDTDEEKLKSAATADETMSLEQVEDSAKKLALNEVSRRSTLVDVSIDFDIISPLANMTLSEPLPEEDMDEEAGVFAEAPALLGRLRDCGLAALADHMLMHFKAGLREYKAIRWHALVVMETKSLSISGPLCAPLSGLCARLSSATARLAPPLAAKLRILLASIVDKCIFENIVLERWFNTGGTMQFTHDVKRNLVPAFAPPDKVASELNQLPKLLEACKLLNLDYDDAQRLFGLLSKHPQDGEEALKNHGICHIPHNEAIQILFQRTDLSEVSGPPSVMELF